MNMNNGKKTEKPVVAKPENVKIVLKLDDLREIVGGSTNGPSVLTEGVVPPPAATVMCP
jgi:hypothetical protein